MALNDQIKPGSLYIVATPIGHLDDISLRALQILGRAQHILAEDTRHTQILLHHHRINVPLVSLHRFNELQRCEWIATKLQTGAVIALVSDAGTPVVSDPGARLIRYLHERDYPIVPIPGACALITALSASGFSGDRFVFEGFLPVKQKARQQRLTELQHEDRTLIFYEAPHRIVATLADMLAVYSPDRCAVLARELTKKFETIKVATLAQLNIWLMEDKNRQKGEFVILLRANEILATEQVVVTPQQVLVPLLQVLPLKQVVAIATQITALARNEVYQQALDLKAKMGGTSNEQT